MFKRRVVNNTCAEKSSKKWCECGYKKHGKNHDQGDHHQTWLKRRPSD